MFHLSFMLATNKRSHTFAMYCRIFPTERATIAWRVSSLQKRAAHVKLFATVVPDPHVRTVEEHIIHSICRMTRCVHILYLPSQWANVLYFHCANDFQRCPSHMRPDTPSTCSVSERMYFHYTWKATTHGKQQGAKVALSLASYTFKPKTQMTHGYVLLSLITLETDATCQYLSRS